MIPDVDVPPTPDDVARGNGCHIGVSLEILNTLFPSSEALNGSLSVSAKSMHVAGGSAPGAPLAFMLS